MTVQCDREVTVQYSTVTVQYSDSAVTVQYSTVTVQYSDSAVHCSTVLYNVTVQYAGMIPLHTKLLITTTLAQATHACLQV